LHYLLDDHDRLYELYGNDEHPVPDDMIARKGAVSGPDALMFLKEIVAPE
jgi:hypothetical protein